MLVLIVLILIVSAKFRFPEKILYPAGKKDAVRKKKSNFNSNFL